MAKDKERSINPAQQARKQEKNRVLKKAKSEQQARRNEKLARRNPQNLQRQIDDLKALEASDEIKPREKAILADLERDLRAVQKAREALGDKAPSFGNAWSGKDFQDGNVGKRGKGVLGKRGRDGERRDNVQSQNQDLDSGEETDDSVRAIPMPRDTPPPVPREFRRNGQQRYYQHNPDAEGNDASPTQAGPKAAEQKTTYSAAPQLRDLRQEATSRFVPAAVKRKQNVVKGVGGALLEPEEMDRLEAAGYYKRDAKETSAAEQVTGASKEPDDTEARRLEEEEARFERELAATGAMEVDADIRIAGTTATTRPARLHQVEIEEVEDEDL